MTECGLMELLHHFNQFWRYRHMKTWTRGIQGREIWLGSDYILGTDRRRFEMVGIWGVRNYPADHLVLRARPLFSPTEAGYQCDAGGILGKNGTVNGGSNDTGRYQSYVGVGYGRGTGDILTRR